MHDSPAARTFRRFFGQDLFHAVLLLGLVMALASPALVPSELTQDSDLWWHLADARTLVSTHHFIRTEPYSFAVAGQRWINPEWLAELPYWFSYSALGLRGIHLAALVGLATNLLLIYFRGSWKSSNRAAAFWSTVLAFFLVSINMGARAIVVAWLALSVELAILEAAERGRTRMLWLLPPLFCLWINLHGSWLIGLGFFALYLLCSLFPVHLGALEQSAIAAAERNRLIGVFLTSCAALWINPYGWRMLWNPFDMLLNQKLNLALVEEWHPLSLGTTTGLAAAASIAILILCNLVCGRSWKLYELAFLFAAWFLAFSHQRFAFLAAVVATPWIAAELARSFFGAPSDKTIPALNALFTAAILGACIWYFPAEAELQRNLAAGLPIETIESIQPTWRTFNDFNLGGRMAFQSKPNFLDSRVDTFEHHGILQQYIAIENLNDPFRLLDANRIDHVLTAAGTPLAYTLERAPGWRLDRREGTVRVYEFFTRVPKLP